MRWLSTTLIAIAPAIVCQISFDQTYLANADFLVLQDRQISSNLDSRLNENKNDEKAVLPIDQIKQKARLITVRVDSGETWGSGIIIDKQNNTYTVVTNNHVLIFSKNKSYLIQTPDGNTHEGTIVKTVDFEDNDLGLVQFSSDREYQVTALSPVSNAARDKVFAAGFPVEIESQEKSKGFYFTVGNIAQINQLAFGGGYQIGYTNNIEKGMSGGPLLNIRGEVVAINGVHKYPLWGNPYVFSDGTEASEATKEEMSKLSWGIPINTFLQLTSQLEIN